MVLVLRVVKNHHIYGGPDLEGSTAIFYHSLPSLSPNVHELLVRQGIYTTHFLYNIMPYPFPLQLIFT